MQGGFISKRPEWVNPQKPELFAVEDPQEPGKDIAGGSFQVKAVRKSLPQAVPVKGSQVLQQLHVSPLHGLDIHTGATA